MSVYAISYVLCCKLKGLWYDSMFMIHCSTNPSSVLLHVLWMCSVFIHCVFKCSIYKRLVIRIFSSVTVL